MAAQEAPVGTKDRLLVAVTLGLFGVACCLPAVDKQWICHGGALQDRPNDGPVLGPGVGDLVFGWLSGHPAWLANPALAVAVVLLLFGQRRCAAVAGVLAASLGLTTCQLFGLAELYRGYYVWQASQVMFAAGACWFCWSARSRRGNHQGTQAA